MKARLHGRRGKRNEYRKNRNQEHLIESLTQAYAGKKILVTGHTGFKGSWLAQWLTMLGAEVKGYALAPEKSVNHFNLLKLDIDSEIADIRDRQQLEKSFSLFKPDLVFHLAAQPLVRQSYSDPLTTFDTNLMGLVNVLEVARHCSSVKAFLNVTSDKCYENRNIKTGYKEQDPMGGHDPYSASKGCAELITASYRKSFYEEAGMVLASARAGNVVGGGDWSDDRLVPDIMRAIENRTEVHVRRPESTRPWQHVLEPLRGYLMLGQKMLAGDSSVADGWNFGTTKLEGCSVKEVLSVMQDHWSAFDVQYSPEEATFHEAELLQLNSDKAKAALGWEPLLDTSLTFGLTMSWYRNFYEEGRISTIQQIENYMSGAVSC